MAFLRRIPGLLYTHKISFSVALFIFAVVIFASLTTGFICTNFEPEAHVHQLCSNYERELVAGDLCSPLCTTKSISSFSCQPLHSGKETVFSAVRAGGGGVVIKLARPSKAKDIIHWLDEDGEHYPTEDEFIRLIQNRVKARLNFTISDEQARKLSCYPTGCLFEASSIQRRNEMREIWSLLQDNEYLMSVVFTGYDMFPKVIGTCGQYFAVENIPPALSGSIIELSGPRVISDMASRVHLAVQILEVIDQLNSEGILLCDIKPGHFGLSPDGKIKILDLDVAFPKAVADSMTADKRHCTADHECHFFDCKSKCNMETYLCDSPVLSTNLQVVCEKIFLGWTVASRLMVPGLLMTPETKPGLASLLRQCAELKSQEVTEHIEQRLKDTLVEIDAEFMDSD